MAKKLEKKKNVVLKYTNILKEAKAAFFFSGSLTAINTTDVKNTVSSTSKLTLLKNSLFNIACKDLGIELSLNGYNNAIFVTDRIIENAISLNKFVKDNQYNFNHILIGKTLYDSEKIKSIVKLGSENQVYGTLVSIVSTPTSMLVRGLQSPIQKLVFALSQIKK